jgi:NADPH-dependent 2,4-dienoyl-CoA reductase/sulfur reductase-like enzyme
VTVFEANTKAGGQILLTASLKRRREILGIIDWRLSECERLGVNIEYNRYAEESDVIVENPDVVVIATGGLPNLDCLEAGGELAATSWDILGGAVQVAKSVLIYDDNGSHPAMTVAEFVSEAGAQLEVVTSGRTLAPEIGATSYPAYFRALNKANAKITINFRLERLERRGNKIAAIFFDDYARQSVEREVDQVIVESGTKPLDDLYFALKPVSTNRGEVDYKALVSGRSQALVKNPAARFQLFRIGDAVASRNIHAAVYDAHRLMAVV